jgi:ABC-2 type transport system ATP-binding protein
MIEVERVSHHFGSTRALVDVDLAVPQGKVVGLVGPNGAGKSTLMRAIATLLEPSQGSIRVAGRDVIREAPAVRDALGYLPERTELYAELSSHEYLELFAELAGHRDRRTRARRVEAALAHVELTDRRDTPTGALSKGLRQRLALEAALLHDPPALVLDEPSDGLDPESRDRMLHDIRELADEGRAILLSSHVLAEVEAVADEVVILVAGKVVRETVAASRRYAIRLRGSLESARTLLVGREDVRAVSIEGPRLVVDLATGVVDAADAVAALAAAGFGLLELVQDRDTLRDRFRRATDQASGKAST